MSSKRNKTAGVGVWGWQRAGAMLLVAAVIYSHPVVVTAQVAETFGFQELGWEPDGSFEFATEYLAGSRTEDDWGHVEQSDTYAQVGDAAGKADLFFTELLTNDWVIAVSYDLQFQHSTDAHNYLAFGGFDDNSVWMGVGGGQVRIGTGSEFDLTSSALPGGVNQIAAFDVDVPDGQRIALRFGYDVPEARIQNLQLDVDRDGTFELDLLTEPIQLDSGQMDAEAWDLLTFAGRGGARADDVVVRQFNPHGDFNGDLDFDERDQDLMCAAVPSGDLNFDYSGDGVLDLTDISQFAFDNGGLPADTNFDGAVNFNDFLTLSANFSKPGNYSDGDFTCDGQVTFADFLQLSTFFGSAAAQGVGTDRVASVPEPAPSAGLMVAMLAILIQFRHRGRP